MRQAGDAAAVLAGFALRADRRAGGIRFSVRRDFENVRVVVIDSRSRRVIDDNNKRLMVDQAEWEWVTESVTGDWDHVVLAGLGAGSYGTPPASVTVIPGDVHNSYLAPAALPGTAARSAIWQAVCSPVHNVLPPRFRRGYQFAESAAGGVLGTALARLAGGASASTARRAIPTARDGWSRPAKRISPDGEFAGHSAHAPPEKQFLKRSCKRSQTIYDMCKAGSTRVRTELSISAQRPGGR